MIEALLFVVSALLALHGAVLVCFGVSQCRRGLGQDSYSQAALVAFAGVISVAAAVFTIVYMAGVFGS